MFHLIRSNLGSFDRVHDDPYDLILTNPPYVTSGSSSLKKVIRSQGLSTYYTAKGRGTELLALEWVIRNLKPAGNALMIVPDGLLNQKAALALLMRDCIVRAIISLPNRTFYSTPKKTYILVFERKRQLGEQQSDPVFTYLVNEIGETRDAKRWPQSQNDLDAAAALFNQFKGSPTTFNADTVQDSRCKVIPFDSLRQYPHWLVDRFWSPDESRSLEGTPPPRVVSDGEFWDELRNLQRIVAGFNAPGEFADATTYREVSLGDSTLFHLSIGRRHTKARMVADGVPVYSANASTPFGYSQTDVSNQDFSIPSLLWGIDGNFDWNYIPENEPFLPGDHCGVLRVISDQLLPKYIYHVLRTTKDNFNFDRTYRASLQNVDDTVKVKVPIGPDGNFDLDAQTRIADRYDQVQAVQQQLLERLQSFTGMRYEPQSLR